MEYVFFGLGSVFALAALVCCILVIIKMFQNSKTVLAVASLIGLFVCGIGYLIALILGWQNRQSWGLQRVMPIFTAAFFLCVALYGAGYAVVLPKLIQEIEQQTENDASEFGGVDFDSELQTPQISD